jgi:hypothetical protein
MPAAPSAPAITDGLCALVQPAAYSRMRYYHELGLRSRVLNLPMMVALVLTMIWRQVGSVCELVRMLAHEKLLWQEPVPISQQALSKRLLNFPAPLFHGVLEDLLPTLQERWASRDRPLPPEVVHARQFYKRLLIFDGSTLDCLWRKRLALHPEATQTKSAVEDAAKNEKLPALLAGRMGALLHLDSRLPAEVWYEPDPRANDLRFSEQLVAALEPGDLLAIDAGFADYDLYDRLTDKGVAFITRPKTTTVMRVVTLLQKDEAVYDAIVEVGVPATRCRHLMRLVKVKHGAKDKEQWYCYLTNELDRQKLPPRIVAALYRRRWRIEQAYDVVKRLLGLAYLWVGTQNGVALQVWATWILYAVLIDLTDAVAQELDVETDTISVEMCYRGLYHFTTAYYKGQANDPIAFLAQGARLLGIIKRPRKSTDKSSGA